MMIMLAPFSGPWLVAPLKFIPGLEADIVMESFTLIIIYTGTEHPARR